MPQSTVMTSAPRILDGQSPQGLGVDSVAFLDAVGDVVADVSTAGEPQAGPQDARAADPVDVVIAVDDDLPALIHRATNPDGRLDRAGQELGIVQAPHPRFQERDGSLRVVDPAIEQELGEQGRKSRHSGSGRGSASRHEVEPASGHSSSAIPPARPDSAIARPSEPLPALRVNPHHTWGYRHDRAGRHEQQAPGHRALQGQRLAEEVHPEESRQE